MTVGVAVAVATTSSSGLLARRAQTATAPVVGEQLARLIAAVVQHGAFAAKFRAANAVVVVATNATTAFTSTKFCRTTRVAGLEVQVQELGLLAARVWTLLPQDAVLRVLCFC